MPSVFDGDYKCDGQISILDLYPEDKTEIIDISSWMNKPEEEEDDTN